jgi:asparagine synthase (glutamine-hydrolysing)
VCGFIGKISANEINHEHLLAQNKMITCRGPDETKIQHGSLSEYNRSLNLHYALIFNRLAIIDLTDNASQPMYSKKFNTLILFNGEVYNHKILRKSLEAEGIDFSSDHSDTEVLLTGISKHGIKFIDSVIGQFSVVFFDFNTMKVFLIRDRVGQKPLFYSVDKNNLSFSSNLKSLAKLEGNRSINQSSVVDFLNYGVIPSPKTLFENIYKVKPGEMIEINMGNYFTIQNKSTYWDIESFRSEEKFNNKEFLSIFNEAVEQRMQADVNVAALLSGGIDSTSVVKSLASKSNEVNTFSIGYEDHKYDEQKWIEKVVQKYKTNHHTEVISLSDIDNYVDQAISALDEPYADPSIVPSFVISKIISSHYKVGVSGDGGDELLAGYGRIQQLMTFKKYNPKLINNLYNVYPWFLGTGNKLNSRSENLLTNYSSYLSDKKFINALGLEDKYLLEQKFKSSLPHDIKDFMLVDFKFFLSEMMMLKVDRTSMANSLEMRSPFVDHRLIEYSLKHDLSFLINEPKNVLKKFLKNDFDSSFLSRKKMGFVFNLEKWVYSNKNQIFEYLKNDRKFSDVIDTSVINKLNINKSRVNAQRIWKIYILEKYFQDL